jgi:hypothetical protein
LLPAWIKEAIPLSSKVADTAPRRERAIVRDHMTVPMNANTTPRPMMLMKELSRT